MKLKDLGEYFIGLTYKPEDVSDKGTIVLRSGNIQDGQFDLSDIVRVDTVIREKQYVKPGDILMCSRNGSARLVGKSTIIPTINEPMTFGAFMTVFRTPYNDYLKYFLQSRCFRAQLAGSKTTTINQITIRMLDGIDIDLPDNSEREERIKKLEILQSIIQFRKQELRRFDDLIKARFVEMFGDPEINLKGWKKEPLKDHATVFVGYPFPSEGYTSEGIDIVGGYNLMQGYILWDESKHWPDVAGYEQYLLRANDIVMAMDRPWVNGGFKIARIDASHLPALLIQRTACIRGKDLEQEFLHSLLDTQRFAKHCNITGSLVPHISNKDINSYQVIVPPTEEQRRFTAFVAQVDKSKVIGRALDFKPTLRLHLAA